MSNPKEAFSVEDLCDKIYSKWAVTKVQRIAVIRAAKAILKKHPETLDCWKGEGRGAPLIFFHHDNVMSYAVARLKNPSMVFTIIRTGEIWSRGSSFLP